MNLILNPIYPIIAYLFLVITTLHLQIPLLVDLHIEALALGAVLILSLAQYYINRKDSQYINTPLAAGVILGSLFIISPLITSLNNQDYLNIIYDDEYRTLIKSLLFSPTLLFVVRDDRNKATLIKTFIFLYTLLALYFMYRFLILHEVRDFDNRPNLKIRHGDANFLCTFFSMMIPMPLMEAWRSWKTKNHSHSLLYLSSAMILLISALLTESRMGLISVFIGLFYLVTRPIFSFSKKTLITSLVLGFIFIAPLSNRLIQRFSEIQDKSNSDRFLTWKNGIAVFWEYSLFGAGMHKSKDFFYKNSGYPDFQSEVTPLDTHNTFLKAAAELGLWGGGMFLLIYFWSWKNAHRMESNDKYFLISSMIILTISIMTIGVLYKDLFIIHLFLVTSLTINNHKKNINISTERILSK